MKKWIRDISFASLVILFSPTLHAQQYDFDSLYYASEACAIRAKNMNMLLNYSSKSGMPFIKP